MSRRDAAHGASDAIGSALYGLATRAVRRLPRDMSLTSAATLATLDKTGPRRITDLAVAEGVTQPAMTVLVRVMEESGLVERKGDPDEIGSMKFFDAAVLAKKPSSHGRSHHPSGGFYQ